jgi:predicted O-methyltransferase YrrM
MGRYLKRTQMTTRSMDQREPLFRAHKKDERETTHMSMEPHPQALLAELQQWGQIHDEREQDWSKKMLNLKPETAQLVSILVRGGRRSRLLEIGTSNGYSTIWLAWATSALGGRVTSIDHDARKLELADINLRRANLRQFVDLRHGDATDVLRTLDGRFDFVLIDSVEVNPSAQMVLVVARLTDDAIVVADNVISHAEDMADYLSIVADHKSFDHVIVPVGKGLSVACRNRHEAA